MSKIPTLLLLCSLAPFTAMAQGLSCGTPPPTAEEYGYTRDVMARVDVQALRNAGTTCVPLQAHVVRKADGTGAPSLQALNIGLSFLNDHYAPAGIEFFWKAMPEYVNNDDYYTFNETSPDNDTEAGLVGLFTIAPDAVNIYFTGTITQADGSVAAGYAYFPNNSVTANRMVIRTDQLTAFSNGVFIHEMGHYLGLYHTFEGTSSGPTSANAENVARTGAQANCSTKGDLLCDTHADPTGSAADLDGCTYIGTAVDQYGVPYTPPVENPMSYWTDQCGTTFTPQQILRVQQGLATRLGHTAYSLDATPQNVNAPGGLTATLGNGTCTLTWTDNASNETGYLVERSNTSASAGFRAISGAATGANGTTWTDQDLASNTTYWYRVKATNGDCNTYSNVAMVEVGLAYCIPEYYGTCAGGTNVVIDGFRLSEGGNNLINNWDSNCSPNGLGDFTAQNANVVAGSSYGVTVTALVGTGSYFPSECQIWIDANHDGDYDDAGEKLLAAPGAMGPTYTGTITIPAGALNGPTRLRVRTWDSANGCNPDACSFCAFGETEEYTVTISGGVNPAVQVALHAFLQGPFNSGTGLMADDLRAAGLVPLQEPYTALGFTQVGGGGESTTAGVLAQTGSTAVVDWVLVELRHATTPATVLATRCGLLLRNGSVVGVNGSSPLSFTVASGNYHVAVRHRNHLGIMTATPVSLGASPATVDFTTAGTATWGSNARKAEGGHMLMWAGDINGDGTVKYAGANNDRDLILQKVGGSTPTGTVAGYHREDVNANGAVKYAGADNDRDPLLQIVGATAPTATRTEQLP